MPRKTAAQKAKATAMSTTPKDTTKPNAKPTNRGNAYEQSGSKKVKLAYEKDPSPTGPAQGDAIAESESTTSLGDVSLRKPGHPRTPLPPPPNSILNGATILPPEADDAKIRAHSDLHFIGVAGSSKMETKIQQALIALKSTPTEGKHVLVALTAPTRAANKCIGITEIVKRDFLRDRDVKLFQYTGCWTRLETHAPRYQTTEKACEDGEKEDEEDLDAFETTDVAERKQVRNATCLVVYLSPVPIPRLRDKFGEQEHDADGG